MYAKLNLCFSLWLKYRFRLTSVKISTLDRSLTKLESSVVQDRILECLFHMERYEEYLNLCQTFIKNVSITRWCTLQANHARFLLRSGKLQLTRSLLEQILKECPDCKAALELTRLLHFSGQEMALNSIQWNVQGFDKKALACVNLALQCEPDNAAYALLKGILLRLAGQFENAQLWLQEVRREIIRSQEDEISKSKLTNVSSILDEISRQAYCVVYDRAVLFIRAGEFRRALEVLNYVTSQETFKEVYIQRGDCLASMGFLQQALRMYSKVVSISDIGREEVNDKLDELAERIASTCLELSRMSLVKQQDFFVVEYYASSALKSLRCVRRETKALSSEAFAFHARAMYMTGCAEKAARDLANSLSLQHGADDHGLYEVLFCKKTPLSLVLKAYASSEEVSQHTGMNRNRGKKP